MRIPRFIRRLKTFSIKEARLCFVENLDNAYETVQAHEKITQNPEMQRILALYDNDRTRSKYPQTLRGSGAERPYFQTLVLANSVRNHPKAGGVDVTIDYRSIEKKNLSPTDPFGLLDRFPRSNDMAELRQSNEALGKLLKEMCTEETLVQIHPDGSSAPDEKLGAKYRNTVELANLAWMNGQKVENEIFVDVSMQYYESSRAQLIRHLRDIGVAEPGGQMEFERDRNFKPHLALSRMTEQEYLALLNNTLKNGPKIYGDKEDPQLARDKQFDMVQDKERRLSKMFNDVAVSKYGPTETLERFGIEITEAARRKYIDARTGVNRDTRGIEYKGEVKPIPSAAEWSYNLVAAYEFLNANIPSSANSQNERFLRSLEYYAITKPKGLDAQLGVPPFLMKEEDVRATLKLLSQSFLEYEQVMSQSNRQREKLKEEVPTLQKIEEFVPAAWEYMLDFGSHPVGSIATAAAFIMTAKVLINMLKKPKSFFTSPLGLALLWGGAYGLYTKHNEGRAWWDKLGNMYDDFMGNEKLKNPTERTLANYWYQEMKTVKGYPGQFNDLTPEKERLSLSLIGDVDVKTSLDWYQKYSIHWKNPKGSKPPKLPFNYYPYSNIYGMNATKDDASRYLFLTMQKFFTHRGTEVKRYNLRFDIPGGLGEEEGLGFAYIREKYQNTHRFYERLIENMGVKKDVILSDAYFDLINHPEKLQNQDALEKMKTANPEMYESIVKFLSFTEQQRKEYVAVVSFWKRRFDRGGNADGMQTKNYPMNHVFFMEGNPEVMSRMGMENKDVSWWQQFKNLVGWNEEYSPLNGPTGNPAQGAAGGAAQGAPGRPNQGAPGRPNQGAPGNPARNAPGRPNQGAPGQPNRGAPGNPARNAPGRPNQGAPGRPNQGAPGNPARNAPGRPNQGAPGRPNQGAPGNPTRNAPGRPNRNPGGRPANNSNPGNPNNNNPGRPNRNPGGRPANNSNPGNPNNNNPGRPNRNPGGRPANNSNPGNPNNNNPGRPNRNPGGRPTNNSNPGNLNNNNPGNPNNGAPGAPNR